MESGRTMCPLLDTCLDAACIQVVGLPVCSTEFESCHVSTGHTVGAIVIGTLKRKTTLEMCIP